MRGRRLWIKAPDGHRVYEQVNLTSSDGHKLHAAYMTDGSVEVSSAAPEVMKKSLFHEYTHKALDGLSGDEMEKLFENEDRKDAEEWLCLILEKTLYPLLAQNGFLKFPPPPSARGKK